MPAALAVGTLTADQALQALQVIAHAVSPLPSAQPVGTPTAAERRLKAEVKKRLRAFVRAEEGGLTNAQVQVLRILRRFGVVDTTQQDSVALVRQLCLGIVASGGWGDTVRLCARLECARVRGHGTRTLTWCGGVVVRRFVSFAWLCRVERRLLPQTGSTTRRHAPSWCLTCLTRCPTVV